MKSFKVGDRVQLSAFGKKNTWIGDRTDRSGTVISIEDDGIIMRDGSIKPITAYRVQFDENDRPRNWQRKFLKKSNN